MAIERVIVASTLRDHAAMAYDRELAQRIREIATGKPGVVEKKIFGGLAFLIGGNLAVAASGQGGLMVRVDPTESDALLANSPAHPLEMRGRAMQGWLRVDIEDLTTDDQLADWVERGITYACSLPTKH